MNCKEQVFQRLKGKLIVSCQALEHEPLHGSDVMGKMAKAAYQGGAAGIRANGAEDIKAIKQYVNLPIIGLVKRDYEDSEVYITATKKEVDELMGEGVDIIAIDATSRTRPNGETLEGLIAYLKSHNQKIMADISSFEEGIAAEKLGVDCISTTMSGYTPYSPQQKEPDFNLLEKLVSKLTIPVFAEGRISTPDQAEKAINLGAHSVVVGSAITRPQEIAKNFAQQLEQEGRNRNAANANYVQKQDRRLN